MGVYFNDEAAAFREAVERAAEYLEGARWAQQSILEDEYALLRGLISDFVGLFGKQPATDEAAQFLGRMREELDAVKSTLRESYGRDISDISDID